MKMREVVLLLSFVHSFVNAGLGDEVRGGDNLPPTGDNQVIVSPDGQRQGPWQNPEASNSKTTICLICLLEWSRQVGPGSQVGQGSEDATMVVAYPYNPNSPTRATTSTTDSLGLPK